MVFLHSVLEFAMLEIVANLKEFYNLNNFPKFL